MKTCTIYRATRLSDGATAEGTAREVSEALHITKTSIIEAARSGKNKNWKVEKLRTGAVRTEKQEKVCPVCGKKFLASSKNRKYCSEKCAREAQTARWKKPPKEDDGEKARLKRRAKLCEGCVYWHGGNSVTNKFCHCCAETGVAVSRQPGWPKKCAMRRVSK